MKDFQQLHKNKPKKRSKLLLLLMLVIVISLARGSMSTYFKERESRIEVQRVLAEKQELEGRYSVISEQSDALKSDIGVETEIRNKFDVVKKGEGVIVVVEKEAPVIEEEKKGVLRRFWDSVRGVFGSDEGQKGPGGASAASGTRAN